MHKLLGYLCLVILLSACDGDRVFDSYADVRGSWGIEEPVTFEVSGLDSIQMHNVFITTRNNYEYPYSNLFLVMQLDFPNGRRLTDTLEYTMAAPDGTWLGKGFSDVKESKLWYKENVRFRESGTYTFSVKHAMRKNGNVQGDAQLVGITEVGLRIERLEQ